MGWVMKMDKEKELPKRKPTRLKNFDYSSAGAYFVTICIRDRMHILSEIVKTDLTATDKTNGLAVGEGLAPPEITVKLKPCGEVVKEQLQLIEARFPSVTIEDYVIMQRPSSKVIEPLLVFTTMFLISVSSLNKVCNSSSLKLIYGLLAMRHKSQILSSSSFVIAFRFMVILYYIFA